MSICAPHENGFILEGQYKPGEWSAIMQRPTTRKGVQRAVDAIRASEHLYRARRLPLRITNMSGLCCVYNP